MRNLFTIAWLYLLFTACKQPNKQTEGGKGAEKDTTDIPPAANLLPAKLVAPEAIKPPVLDGDGNDSCWYAGTWFAIDQLWIGPLADSTDFSGRYKLAWDKDNLYILAEIKDDTLVETHKPLENYWDDDCLTVFIDEDRSGGEHRYNNNAFAYHIGLDKRMVDMGADSTAHLYPHHGRVQLKQRGDTTTWELAFRIFPEKEERPVALTAGKHIGFALAYNDNDRSPTRENLFGSVYIDGPEKNKAAWDAGVFADLLLEGR